MIDQPNFKDSPPTAAAEKVTETVQSATSDKVSHSEENHDAESSLGAPKPVNELTPEEQMALFEKELKEKDWGHQPC